ncbi:hypothetical protein [Deinococcus radiodurans]|uniref:hypothetical protein n=1 Tax=Deinococcus radiodurans TaxID=1299 RepID=UPI003211B813
MNFWRWLTTPDPHPGFTRPKLLKLAVRLFLFVLLATVLSSLLNLTPLRPYLNTFWGSLLFVLLLYIPAARFLNIDTFMPRRFQTPPPSPAPERGNPQPTRWTSGARKTVMRAFASRRRAWAGAAKTTCPERPQHLG